MKKLLILLFSILISFNSFGEWMLISTSNVDNSKFYVDTETIKERDSFLYVWELDDYSLPLSDTSVLSVISLKEIDCTAMKMRNVVIHYYEKNMGKGEIYLTDESPAKTWTYPPPGSNFYYIINYSCEY